MRITYLHQYFNTLEMPGGTRSYEMASRLVSMGHEVNMITTWQADDGQTGWHTTEESGINVHWLPVPYSNHMSYAARMRAFLKFAAAASKKAASMDADVIFATSTPLTISIPALWTKWRRAIPMVFEVRDLWPAVPIALGILKNPILVRLARWLERYTYLHANQIVALAPGMADGVINCGAAPHRVSIIPNGCDLKLFSASESASVSSELNVAYIGTIGAVNGVEYIVRLAATLQQRQPETIVRFLIVGDGKRLADVQKLAATLGVNGSRILFFGNLPKNQIPDILRKCRFTIMTYDGPEILYRDSVSNKFFDSLAAGKPIFANFSGFSTLIAQAAGVCSILPRDNLGQSADIVLRLIKDDDYLEKCRIQCQRLAAETFNRDRLAAMLQTVLQRAIDSNDIYQDDAVVGVEFRHLLHRAIDSAPPVES